MKSDERDMFKEGRKEGRKEGVEDEEVAKIWWSKESK